MENYFDRDKKGRNILNSRYFIGKEVLGISVFYYWKIWKNKS